jgi:hypothetical protein
LPSENSLKGYYSALVAPVVKRIIELEALE